MRVARILSIIGLIVGLIIGLLSLFPSFMALSTFSSEELTYFKSLDKNKEVLDKDDADYEEYEAFKMAKRFLPISIISILLTIIAGVLGFRGHLMKIKLLYLSIILLICGIVLLSLNFGYNFIHAILFIIASVLYFIHYRKNEQNKAATT
jgi:hypothetical protein